MIHAFLVATGLVALAEIGDKTQLLALLLAAKFKRPWPIVAGIFVATLANHAGAGWVGNWLGHYLGSQIDRDWLSRAIGLGFVIMAIWALVPDKLDEKSEAGWSGAKASRAFLATTIAFFLVEMGDKTQIATIALAARFDSLFAVILGTTCGMMLANAPVVFLGDHIARRLPVRYIRWAAAGCFFLLGLSLILGWPAL